jgi:hypothetical protein
MIMLRRLLVWSVTAACIVLAPSNFAQQVTTGSVPSNRQHGPIVNAPAGTVEGRMEGELRVFKGIPYALPPVGSARWRPPSPMPRWTGVRERLPSSEPHACSPNQHSPISTLAILCL